MKILRNKLILIALAVVAMGAGFMVANQLVSKDHVQTAEASAAGVQIQLQGNKATPDTVTVKVGETVQFNTADGKKHEIALGQGGHDHEHIGTYSSGDFGAGEAWRVQFKQAGNYYFHDHFNPDINVLVVVYTPTKH